MSASDNLERKKNSSRREEDNCDRRYQVIRDNARRENYKLPLLATSKSTIESSSLPLSMEGDKELSTEESQSSLEVPGRMEKCNSINLSNALEKYAFLLNSCVIYEQNSNDNRKKSHTSASAIIPTVESINKRYKRIVKVGEGSFGEVYIIYDTVAETYMVMKRMFRLLHSPNRALLGLHSTTFRELRLISTLHHPNIVKIIDYHILRDGSLIIFTPLLAHDLVSLMRNWNRVVETNLKLRGDAHKEQEQESLEEKVNMSYNSPSIKNYSRMPQNVYKSAFSRIPLSAVKCIFKQILHGVAYLHRHKIIHRDLKPSNIMLHHNGIVNIIDFGWSRFCTSAHHGKMTGPPCNLSYRPPEVMLKSSTSKLSALPSSVYSSHYDFGVDIWCCGCILFELLNENNHHAPLVQARNEMEALDVITEWLIGDRKSAAINVISEYNKSEKYKKSMHNYKRERIINEIERQEEKLDVHEEGKREDNFVSTCKLEESEKLSHGTRRAHISTKHTIDTGLVNNTQVNMNKKHLQNLQISPFVNRCKAIGIDEGESTFMECMLAFEPSKRWTAEQLLRHEWFATSPIPCTPKELPLPPFNTYRWFDSWHQHNRRRQYR